MAALAGGSAGASNTAGSGVGRTGAAGGGAGGCGDGGHGGRGSGGCCGAGARRCGGTALVGAARGGANGRGAAGGRGDGDSTGTHGATGAMEAGDGWPRGVGARSAQYASSSGGYSPKLASITATRSSSASMSCWFTSSIFCKSAGEAFST